MASLVAASFPEKVERCVFLDILGPYAFSPATSPKRLRTSIASRSEFSASGSEGNCFACKYVRTTSLALGGV